MKKVFPIEWQVHIVISLQRKKEMEAVLKENQIRLELAMNAGEHGFWDWNLMDNQTYFSPTYYTMLGYEDEEIYLKCKDGSAKWILGKGKDLF